MVFPMGTVLLYFSRLDCIQALCSSSSFVSSESSSQGLSGWNHNAFVSFGKSDGNLKSAICKERYCLRKHGKLSGPRPRDLLLLVFLIEISEYEGYNQKEFDVRYNRVVSKDGGWRGNLKKCLPVNVKECVMNTVPVLKLVRTYKFKGYIANDIISGLSVGFMAIPQSFGYTRIANVPEVIGLYTSLFPVIVYFLFTTSKHSSLGTMALTSLIIGSVINTLQLPSQEFRSSTPNASHPASLNESENYELSRKMLQQQDDDEKILVMVSLSCAAGLMLLLMSFLRMGFIVSFMSDAFISGFLSSATVRIVTLQIRDVLGVRPKRRHMGFCEFFLNTYELFCMVGESNLVQIAMSVIALSLLILVKEIVNKRYKEKLKIPIPIEIIVVIVFILVSKYANLESDFNVEVSSNITAGLPSLTVPSLNLMYLHAYSALLTAIISFTMVGMMAKLFAQNHGYNIDNNQEMLAVGLSSVIGSFFCSMIPSTSPTRCMLVDSTGAKTQLSHVFTALFALLTMVAFAPFLSYLPVCILGCMIIVACLPLFGHFAKFYTSWASNKYDFSVWCITFVTVLVFSVETGLLVGVLCSLIAIHVWMKNESHGTTLERNGDGLFLDKDVYAAKLKATDEIGREFDSLIDSGMILIFRFESSLYFATVENFKELFFSKVPSYIALIKSKGKKKNHKKSKSFRFKKVESCGRGGEVTNANPDNVLPSCGKEVSSKCVGDAIQNPDVDKFSQILLEDHQDVKGEEKLKLIIIDFSAVPFCDMVGAETLAHLSSKYLSVGIDLCIVSCNENVKNQLIRVSRCKNLVENFLYPSISDAYLSGIKKQGTIGHSTTA